MTDVLDDLDPSIVQDDTIKRLPYQFCKHHHVLLEPVSNQYVLYCTDHLSIFTYTEVQKLLYETPFVLQKIDQISLDKLISRYYQENLGSTSSTIDNIQSDLESNSISDYLPEPEDLLNDSDEAPIIRLINAIIAEAIRDNASDIHIEPDELVVNIRFRIDGVLRPILQPDVKLASFLISRIKIMSKLDIAEKRIPQDGRIALRLGSHSIDIRVSTLPGNLGERVVLRILDKENTRLALNDLGLEQAQRKQIENLITLPHGIILVTGPTGSGKTTTLYAMLNELDKSEKNIITIEDPVEYQLQGVSQTQVDSKVGLTFSKGLRAILRQDPDVVMVGEIRDKETAEIAVQASLTGHLVLSTLHTNTAIGTIARLRDMGVESFLLSSSLVGVMAQRLIRRLCPDCKTPTTIENSVIAQKLNIGLSQTGTSTIYEAQGCEKCNFIGYKGRIGIYEIIPINKSIKQLIHDDANESAISELAHRQTRSIIESAKNLLLEGKISLDEILRIITER